MSFGQRVKFDFSLANCFFLRLAIIDSIVLMAHSVDRPCIHAVFNVLRRIIMQDLPGCNLSIFWIAANDI